MQRGQAWISTFSGSAKASDRRDYSARSAITGSTCVARGRGWSSPERDGGQDRAHDAERQRIGRLDLEEQPLHQAREQERAATADRDPGRPARAPADDHAQHVAALRAERHPDADLLRALR